MYANVRELGQANQAKVKRMIEQLFIAAELANAMIRVHFEWHMHV